MKLFPLTVGDETYFLPYDARFGAVSTYIAESQLADWLNQIQSRKALIQATWDAGETNDMGFSSRLADILSSEDTDGDRRVDSYVAANAVTNWADILSVRLSVLASSIGNNVTDDDSPQTYTFDDGVNTGQRTATDRRLRQAFTTTVALRNRVP